MIARYILRYAAFAFLVASVAVLSPAKGQNVPAPPSQPDPAAESGLAGRGPQQGSQDIEVRLRGPVHEAFALPVEKDPQPGLVVSKQPPAPINEMPPEVRPTGDNVAWISGYWAWSDEDKDFIWVSGVWRNSPPGQKWVPGYWVQADNGWRWNAGMWVASDIQQITYLAQPPASQERGPTSEQPGDEYFWVPGCWIWQTNNYAWRPGYWARGQNDYCWIPDYYTWTPRGYVFCNGYWDYYLARRGWLFSPVWFGHDYWRYNNSYRPWYLLDASRLLTHWWVRPNYSHYYFGDWYGRDFTRFGIYPWSSGSWGRGYDPLFTYYSWWHHRQGIDFHDRMVGWNRYYDQHHDARPFDKLGAAADLRADANVQARMLGTRLDDFSARHTNEVARLNDTQVRALSNTTQQLRDLSQLRVREEVRADAGVRTDRGGNNLGGPQAHTALRLPAVDQPLQANRGGTPQLRGGAEFRGGTPQFRGGTQFQGGTELRGGSSQFRSGGDGFQSGSNFRSGGDGGVSVGGEGGGGIGKAFSSGGGGGGGGGRGGHR